MNLMLVVFFTDDMIFGSMFTSIYNTLQKSSVTLSCFNFSLVDSDDEWYENQMLVRHFLRFSKSVLILRWGVAEVKKKPSSYLRAKQKLLRGIN